eukprot:IDg7156t1
MRDQRPQLGRLRSKARVILMPGVKQFAVPTTNVRIGKFASSPFLRATWISTEVIELIFPIPAIAVRSANFGDTRLSPLPSSQRTIPLIVAVPSDTITSQEKMHFSLESNAEVLGVCNPYQGMVAKSRSDSNLSCRDLGRITERTWYTATFWLSFNIHKRLFRRRSEWRRNTRIDPASIFSNFGCATEVDTIAVLCSSDGRDSSVIAIIWSSNDSKFSRVCACCASSPLSAYGLPNIRKRLFVQQCTGPLSVVQLPKVGLLKCCASTIRLSERSNVPIIKKQLPSSCIHARVIEQYHERGKVVVI